MAEGDVERRFGKVRDWRFLAAVINFLIIGLVAWRISKIFIKPAAEAPKKNCAYCRMSIDAAAIRCPYCTSQLAPA